MEGFSFPEVRFAGSYSYSSPPEEIKGKVIAEGIKKLKAEPDKWAGLMYQSDMVSWPEDQQTWTLYDRASGFTVQEQPGGPFTFMKCKYVALPPATFTDSIVETQEMGSYGGNRLEWKRPGRGEGLADWPGLKLFGDIDPDDIKQGQVGDCWLVSAISALSEFDGEVKSLFSTGELSKDGKYSFSLYDLPSKEWKEVTVDDRLACINGNLLSLKPTADNEIWPLLLEKAFCYHAGGWNKINGGQSTLAFVVFSGCTETFTIKNQNEGSWPPSYCKLQPEWDKYEENNCHCPQACQGMPLTEFPNGSLNIGPDELFDLLCEWDAQNFVVCAGTGAGSDSNNTDGIVDGHAYSLIAAKKQVCGKVDLLLFRNPHGQTEFVGGWRDGGPEWQANPDVKAELGHMEDPDDGLFWMEKGDALRYFHAFYICCKSMDQGRIAKFENKAPEIKSNRKQNSGSAKISPSMEPKPDQTAPSPAAPPVAPIAPAPPDAPPIAPAPPTDAGWGGGGKSNDAVSGPTEETQEGGCMDSCKGCTIC